MRDLLNHIELLIVIMIALKDLIFSLSLYYYNLVLLK